MTSVTPAALKLTRCVAKFDSNVEAVNEFEALMVLLLLA